MQHVDLLRKRQASRLVLRLSRDTARRPWDIGQPALPLLLIVCKLCEQAMRSTMRRVAVGPLSAQPVSYTHLTLPTKA